MLQRIRENLNGPLAYFVLGAISLVFVAWGAYGIVDVGIGQSAYAAKVNGEKIPLETARQAWLEQQAQAAQAFGGEIPEDRKALLQQSVLEGLITRAMLDDRLHDLGYRVTDEQIKAAIQQEPAFQVDGKYDSNIAKARLAQVGLTVAGFEADLRTSLARQQLQRAIAVSDFVTPAEVDRIIALEDEQREVRYTLFNASDYAPATVSDAEVRAYYEANTADFMTTESVRLAYGELRLEQIAARITVVDDDLRRMYAENQDRYTAPETRRARHILVDDEKTARDLLAQLGNGADFAALAAAHSKDTVSAANGGDLGFATRETFVAPFADVLFGMQVGETQGPVQTEFGYHLIRLDAIEPGRTRTFEESRAELEAQYRRDQAADRFGDAQEQLQVRTEQPGITLDALAQEFSLATGQVDVYERGSGGGPLGADPGLEEIVFSDVVLNQGRVGGPVALGEDRLVVVQVLEHRPPQARPLAEVQASIVSTLKHEQGMAAARAAADALLARLEKGEKFDVEARQIARVDPSVPAEVRAQAFSLPHPDGEPLRTVVPTAEGAAVVALLGVKTDLPPLSPAARQERLQQIIARVGASDVIAYIAEARENAKVSVNPKVFE